MLIFFAADSIANSKIRYVVAPFLQLSVVIIPRPFYPSDKVSLKILRHRMFLHINFCYCLVTWTTCAMRRVCVVIYLVVL